MKKHVFIMERDSSRLHLVYTIWIFTLFVLFQKSGMKVVLIGFLLSTLIEIIQLFRIGLFEFDDMIGNTIGCLIESVIGRMVKRG